MSERMQPIRMVRSIGQFIGLVASVGILAFFGAGDVSLAQDDGNRAGLVVQFGDGSLFTACVELGPAGTATGEEVLQSSGLTALIDYGSGYSGGTVCKIEGEGCDFPAENCFCQCTMKPGDPCIYWSYFHLVDGQWRYSPQGASMYEVAPGDVEGWAWGLGSSGTGVAPPVIPFEEICYPAPEVTETYTPTAQAPTAAGASSEPAATETLTPTSSSSPPGAERAESTKPAAPTPTSGQTAAGGEEASTTPVDTEAPTAVSSEQSAASDDASSNSFGYIVFGVLAVALVAGLIFVRAR
jgi:hypothetical protein